jgi:hypothetical protein
MLSEEPTLFCKSLRVGISKILVSVGLGKGNLVQAIFNKLVRVQYFFSNQKAEEYVQFR